MSITEQNYINGEPIEEDQVPEESPTTVVENDEVEEPREHDTELDDVDIQVAHREWVVEGDFTMRRRDESEEVKHFKRTYVQKPLSFTSMLQFTGLIGETISLAMSGPEGVSLDGVLNEGDSLVSAGRSILTSEDFSGIDSFVKGLSKLATYVPSVVEDCQCIWLRIPIQERPIVKEIWSRSPIDGGLTFSEGQEMLEVFLKQNYDEVDDFFGERLRRLRALLKKLRAKKSQKGESRSSKPSRRTAEDTPSQ